MKAILLGPHPGNGSLSTTSYFTFYRAQLPSCLPGWNVSGACPGGVANGSGSHSLVKTRWQNFVDWPFRLTGIRGDLIHVVDQGLAWYGEFLKGGRRLVTVHDLIAYMTWKGNFNFHLTPPRKQFLLWRCIRQIKDADHLVSVSNCTAGHLMSLLEIPASKITVVPNVLEGTFCSLSPPERERARQQWFANADYVVIHVGKPSSYKNRVGALRAFDLLHRRLPGARMFLMHGSPSGEESAFLAECQSRAAISFLPQTTRAELRRFYGAADVLIFPSLYEGFGWPPLEAMACGCPVVCSTRGSLKEVVADAALTVDDPHDHEAFAQALWTVLRDVTTASDLRRRGLERVKAFAPATMLRQMAEVYERVGQNA